MLTNYIFQFILCNNGGGGERMRSFSHNGMNRNGRPKSDGFSSSNTAVASYTYSCADTAAAASLTSSPSSEPLIPDKGWLKAKKTVVFASLNNDQWNLNIRIYKCNHQHIIFPQYRRKRFSFKFVPNQVIWMTNETSQSICSRCHLVRKKLEIFSSFFLLCL